MRACLLFPLILFLAFINTEKLNSDILSDIKNDNDEPVLDSDLKEDLTEIVSAQKRIKVAACLIIIRTSLSQGNTDVSNALKETKHDKSKTFDKIKGMMLDTCVTNITEHIIETVLQPVVFSNWDPTFEELIKFNTNIFLIIGPELKLEGAEKEIIDDINHIISHPILEQIPPMEEIDFMTTKFGVRKYLIYGLVTGFSIFAVFLVISTKFSSKV